jgi:hypothetical protein
MTATGRNESSAKCSLRASNYQCRLFLAMNPKGRPSQHDPKPPVALLRSGLTAGHCFSRFASTKRPYVTSHTQPGAAFRIVGPITVVLENGVWPLPSTTDQRSSGSVVT